MNADDRAILIGINHYPQLGEPGADANLQGPANDVDAVKAWLMDPNGGAFASEDQIQVIKSRLTEAGDTALPTTDEIETAFGRLNAIARQNQAQRRGLRVGRRLYIFVSGHGFSPGRERGCLFAANASATLGTFNVHATGWLNWLQDAGYFREFVLWMDCCMNRVSFLQPRDPQLSPVQATDPPAATFVAFAAQRPLKAIEIGIPEDGDKIHGAFTWALLQGLRGAASDANGRVTGRSLADWLRNALCARMTPAHLRDGDVAKEPEIVQEDAGLIFARGVPPPRYTVTLTLPPEAAGKPLRLWSGIPPRAEAMTAQPAMTLPLTPGLYVVEVPEAGLRQGFEVTNNVSIAITATGPPVTPAPDGTMFPLDIDPADPAAEIFVIDSRFSLVDNGMSKLSTPLPFGLFKIKTRIGRSLAQHVILLDSGRPPLPAAQIAKPASSVLPPVGLPEDGAQERDRQTALATALRLLREGDGKQATLMVMARAASSTEVPQRNIAPWRDVQVVDADDNLVISMERGSARHTDADSHACAVQAVPPGVYYLRQKVDNGPVIEQSLIACESWGLEAYVLRRTQPGEHAPSARPRVSLMMRRPDQQPDAALEKIIETARLALADERRILSAELEDILLRNCTNPIGGLIGGHLLLVERERDPGRDISLLDVVVTRLRKLVGDSHPDVAALGQQCATASLRRFAPLTGPPMFQRSWKLLVAAAQRREDWIPEAMWRRVVAQTALPPLMVWAADDSLRQTATESLRAVPARSLRASVPPAGLRVLTA
ncbi:MULTISPECIES: caspase family protein [Cupriavidus]|uniref:Peptidase C14 caspase domain-containing protein n=3 Tax=Burkholderiaceae TaxID=119060 RepID=A0ABY3ERG3_9BURK|nr:MULTISPECIES: caspase family protein [Cupriavidus]TSP13444.1 hypothetical protein FGG12_07305 [Cupriavidus campinensis]